MDNKGVLDPRHMRCNPERHPGLEANGLVWRDAWSTRLKEQTWVGHDDWDCVDDLREAGFLTVDGTGLHPVVKLTPQGVDMAHALRRHKMKGGSFHDFEPPSFCEEDTKPVAQWLGLGWPAPTFVYICAPCQNAFNAGMGDLCSKCGKPATHQRRHLPA